MQVTTKRNDLLLPGISGYVSKHGVPSKPGGQVLSTKEVCENFDSPKKVVIVPSTENSLQIKYTNTLEPVAVDILVYGNVNSFSYTVDSSVSVNKKSGLITVINLSNKVITTPGSIENIEVGEKLSFYLLKRSSGNSMIKIVSTIDTENAKVIQNNYTELSNRITQVNNRATSLFNSCTQNYKLAIATAKSQMTSYVNQERDKLRTELNNNIAICLGQAKQYTNSETKPLRTLIIGNTTDINVLRGKVLYTESKINNASSSAIDDVIMRRDSNGRSQVSTPDDSDTDYIVNIDYLINVFAPKFVDDFFFRG